MALKWKRPVVGAALFVSVLSLAGCGSEEHGARGDGGSMDGGGSPAAGGGTTSGAGGIPGSGRAGAAGRVTGGASNNAGTTGSSGGAQGGAGGPSGGSTNGGAGNRAGAAGNGGDCLTVECFVANECVTSCGQTPQNYGCCPCPAGTVSARSCATPAADAGAAGVSCNPSLILCKRVAPTCPMGEVPSVEGSCYGPCVRIDACNCSAPEDCPDSNQYTCHRSQGRCGPYV